MWPSRPSPRRRRRHPIQGTWLRTARPRDVAPARELSHSPMTQPLLQAADLRGAARLTIDAVAGLTSLVEAMHARIASLPRLPGHAAPTPDEHTRGLTGLVYETVRGVTRVVGGSADALLGWL